MKAFWTQAALGAIALLFVGVANADVINFESVDTTFAPFAPLLADGDAVIQGNYFVNTQDLNQGGGLIGQLSLGSDPTTCLNGVCPGGNTSNFLSVYNDGIVHIGLFGVGVKILFGGLDAAYIATPGNPPGSTDFLVIEADRADGSFAAFYYPLLGSGAFQTITASTPGNFLSGTGTLTSGTVTDLFIYSYFCNGSTGTCNAFSNNRGQFALDNIVVAAVPEPSELLLALTGLAVVSACSRRRRTV